MTLSEIGAVQGEAGNFKVEIRRKPRYVKDGVCTGCGECAIVCPVERSSEFDRGLSKRKAIYRAFPQGIPNTYAIEKLDRPPCVTACPAGVNVQGYVQLVQQGKYEQAVRLIMERLPLPGVLGRVCPHPCESQCRRLEVDEAVAIKDLKRHAADRVDLENLPVPEIVDREEKVAIVGSGPAGLTVAYYLRLKGYRITIFEALERLGGMLRVGIPDFRLPPEILDREINHLLKTGIEVKSGVRLGVDFTLDSLKEQGFNVIFLGTGAHDTMKLRIPGEDEFQGVVDAVEFLRQVNLGLRERPGKRVTIIGGGNVAIDAARAVKRLGSEEVTIVYRRTKNEMPAYPEEIEGALAEGVKMHFLTAPVRILGSDGKTTGLECLETELSTPDESGRRRPVPVDGSEFIIECDVVIPAIGQMPDVKWADGLDDPALSAGSTFVVNPHTMQTTIPDVFAAGDAVSGPATVVKAIADGHKAVEAIHCYLKGEDLGALAEKLEAQEPPGRLWNDIPEDTPREKRAAARHREARESVAGFDEVDLGFEEEAARSEASRCLNCGVCSECMECVRVCEAKAVDHQMEEEIREVEVGGIILAPGTQPIDPSVYDTYGYKRFPNVMTSLEFERMLSPSGPFGGHVVRPSDKKEPEKIAWLQCVGSRDVHQGAKSYCSTVCCTYAIKEASVAKEHVKGLDTAIFYIDIRTHGKGYEQYYNRARDQKGIRFIKSRIASIQQVGDSGDLRIWYTDESGRRVEETFDMVILSVGLCVSDENVKLAQNLGVDVDANGFPVANGFDPLKTTRPGVFACGTFRSPKAIPSSIIDASASAGVAAALLTDSRNTLTQSKEIPRQKDVRGEPPRLGVFVCDCGKNIAGVVDVPSVVEYAKNLPHVAYAQETLFACSQNVQEDMAEAIREKGLNRIVVAACTPRTHAPLFQETLINAGLNKYLFEMANIRNQCSWVHAAEPDLATEKSKDLVRMAAARAAQLEPLSGQELGINHAALVIGGGIAGMCAALNLAGQGYHTHLIEKSGVLGGQARNLQQAWRGENIQEHLNRMIAEVESQDAVDVHLNAEITNFEGFVGNFKTTVKIDKEEREIEHGVAIIATGASELKPQKYLYREDPRVLTSLDLDRKLMDNDGTLRDARCAVFLQCVGSRIPERPYCSKVCCTHSVVSALKLKEMNPEMDVYIIYRDIRTYGLKEELYRRARRAGVHFIRYVFENDFTVTADPAGLQLRFMDYVLQRNVELRADLLTLAAAIVSPSENPLARMLKVPLNDEGFFAEAHIKLRPVDFNTDGIFVCGLAHNPKPIDESVVQADAAAARAGTILAKDRMVLKSVVSKIDQDLCRGCGNCVDVCPYNAATLVTLDSGREVSSVVEAVCKGCGQCASICPTGAAGLQHFTDNLILTMVESALEQAG